MMGNEELEDVKEVSLFVKDYLSFLLTFFVCHLQDEVGPNADKETLRKVYCALIYKCVKYYMSEKSKNDRKCLLCFLSFIY